MEDNAIHKGHPMMQTVNMAGRQALWIRNPAEYCTRNGYAHAMRLARFHNQRGERARMKICRLMMQQTKVPSIYSPGEFAAFFAERGGF
jgi:hypothetical protein